MDSCVIGPAGGDKTHDNHDGNKPLFVIPICIWCDATHIDNASKFKLEPVSFSPLIFKETASQDRRFWGMLGYIKQLNFFLHK